MAPFVVVLQSHHLAAASAIVVAPLLVRDGQATYTETSANVEFRGVEYVVSVGELAGFDTRSLTRATGDLRAFEDEIRRALDRLFTGF